MKKIMMILLVYSLSFTSYSFAQEITHKNYCMSSIGYKSNLDELKTELLVNAKRLAVGEIFGELITSFTKVENFSLIEDKIRSSSIGFVRIKDDPVYYQGKNLGEVCVKINAYAKEEDFEKFKPKTLTKKSCIAEGDVKTIKGRTEEKVKLEALIDYDTTLQKFSSKQVLPLLHEIKFVEGDFISGTSVYCAKVRGLIYPVEIAALTESSELLSNTETQIKKHDEEAINEPIMGRTLAEISTSKLRMSDSPPSFQNSFVRVTLQSISNSKDKKKVNLVLTLENISKEDLLIAIGRSNKGIFASLLDYKGESWKLKSLNGIVNIWHSGGGIDRKEKYSVFNPGAKNTIVMAFESEKESDATTFSFSADCFRFSKESPIRFSIGISDMKITR